MAWPFAAEHKCEVLERFATDASSAPLASCKEKRAFSRLTLICSWNEYGFPTRVSSSQPQVNVWPNRGLVFCQGILLITTNAGAEAVAGVNAELVTALTSTGALGSVSGGQPLKSSTK